MQIFSLQPASEGSGGRDGGFLPSYCPHYFFFVVVVIVVLLPRSKKMRCILCLDLHFGRSLFLRLILKR